VLKSVHDQHDLGDDENEDENQPDDWWIAVAPEDQGGVQNGLRIFSGKVAGKPRNAATLSGQGTQADSRFHSTDNVG
jgi:hypothetical protein